MRAITSARVSGGVISGSVCSNLDGHLQNETMLGVRVAGILGCFVTIGDQRNHESTMAQHNQEP